MLFKLFYLLFKHSVAVIHFAFLLLLQLVGFTFIPIAI